MTEIFIAGYNCGSYDDYCEVALHAFATEAEAEAFNARHKAEDDHKHRFDAEFRQAFSDWQRANPFPPAEMIIDRVKMPQWEGKKGSKKLASPEVLAEFAQREKAAREELARIGQHNEEVCAEYAAGALAGMKLAMVEIGYTKEEADALQSTYIGYSEERNYTVERIPFGQPEGT